MTIESNLEKITKSDTTTKMEEVQATLAGMVLRENELKEQIKEAKSWAQVVNEPSIEQKEVIQKQIKRQIREEKEIQERDVNIIIKGLKDYGECEKTEILTHDFLRDKLNGRLKSGKQAELGAAWEWGKINM